MQLYLIRHGETDWNREGRCQGLTDLPLNETGQRQARDIAAGLSSVTFKAIYSSPLQRAWATAQVLATEKGICVQPVAALRELDQGAFEGLTYQQIVEQDENFIGRWLREPARLKIPDGESLEQLQRRARRALTDIVARHTEGSVAVVSHNLCNVTLLCWLMKLRLNDFRRIHQDVATINVIEFDGRRKHPVVLHLNDTCHLQSPSHR